MKIPLYIDPLGQPTVTAGCNHTCSPSVRPSALSHFSETRKTKQISLMLATDGRTLAMAEEIINDTCLLFV